MSATGILGSLYDLSDLSHTETLICFSPEGRNGSIIGLGLILGLGLIIGL